MKPTWTLIANGAHARLLQHKTDGRLVVLQSLEHPQSRLHGSEPGEDKAGRQVSGHGWGSVPFAPRLDPQRKEQRHFAHELAELLEVAAQEGRYAAVHLFASSPFLGELKKELGDGTRRLLAGTHDVDLTHVGLAELRGRIQGQ